MAERWHRELDRLGDLTPPEGVLDDARNGPRTPSPSSPRTRIVAAVVAFVLFAIGASFAVRAFDRDVEPIAPGRDLPILQVRLTDAGLFPDGSDMRRVDTSIDYGDVHEEGETSTTPDGAIVEWVGAQDLPMLTPGPTVGSAVEIESDGQEPQVLLGTPDQWPNIDRFQPVDRLPDIAGEYVLIFQARYEEGVARQMKRVQLFDPGAIQLALHEGGSLDTATAEAFVDGRRVEGFLSTSWYMVSDLGAQSAPRTPSFEGIPPLEVTPVTQVVVVTTVDRATGDAVESYEMAPRRLPTELGDTAVPLESASSDTLLVVEARWAHGQVGWAHDGSLETARFFFPITVAADIAEPSPDGAASLELTNLHHLERGNDVGVWGDVTWPQGRFPGIYRCEVIARDPDGRIVGQGADVMAALSEVRNVPITSLVVAGPIDALDHDCGERLDVGTPYEYAFEIVNVRSFDELSDGPMYAEVAYQATWLGGGEVGGAVRCTLDAVDGSGEIVGSDEFNLFALEPDTAIEGAVHVMTDARAASARLNCVPLEDAPSPPPRIEGEIPALCDGRPVTIVAYPESVLTLGTTGDDVVVFAGDGGVYKTGGGHDVACNMQGDVTATMIPDPTG